MNSAPDDNAKSAGDPSTPYYGSTTHKTVSLAHISDPHISCMQDITLRDFISKRLFGYLRWKLHRGTEQGGEVLSALQSDLKQSRPDNIAVTGDLTHLGLSAEYKKARRWLQSLGDPSEVTVIPGNHDAYVKLSWNRNKAQWSDYMISDIPQNSENFFPSLRTRGCLAIIGVSTARPSAPHLAVGSIGAQQMQKLESILTQTARQQIYRILLIHHPPAPGMVGWRKRLTDAAELRSLLNQYGVELILHGHAHRTLRSELQTPAGSIPVIGAPSISALGRTPERRARYYIYRVTPRSGSWNVRLEVRIYSPEEKCFIQESEQQLNME